MLYCSEKRLFQNDFNIAFHLGLPFEKIGCVNLSQHLKGCTIIKKVEEHWLVINPTLNGEALTSIAFSCPILSKLKPCLFIVLAWKGEGVNFSCLCADVFCKQSLTKDKFG